jgi:hypothetical protein
LAILGQNSLDLLKIQSRSKIKNTSPFCLKRTKGKQSMKNHKYKVLKSKITRIIVKCLNSSSNNHRRKENPQGTKSSQAGPLPSKYRMFCILIWIWATSTSSSWSPFNHLSLESLKLIIRKLKSSNQLVCKMSEKIHHWTSNWYKFEERRYRRLCMSWEKKLI